MQIEKPITLDLLDTKVPALSATSDMPVVVTKPDATPEPKDKTPAPEKAKAEDTPAKVDPAAPVEGKTEVEAEPADDLEQPESPSANDAPKKPAKGVQKRLDELTRQAREAERREQAEREEKLRVLALLEAKEKPKEEPAPEELVRPKRDQYATQEEYEDAFIAYSDERSRRIAEARVEAKQKADKEAEQKASIAESNRKVQEAYAARVEKFRASHPDYSEVAEAPDVHVSIPMAHAIANSEHGPEIAYYLGSNKEEAQRIAQLVPAAQLMELGLIVGKLTAAPVKPVSAAPAPIKPIKASTETPATSPEEESMEAYAARRKKEMAAAGRGMRH